MNKGAQIDATRTTIDSSHWTRAARWCWIGYDGSGDGKRAMSVIVVVVFNKAATAAALGANNKLSATRLHPHNKHGSQFDRGHVGPLASVLQW